jgi:D-alanine-D-alanine ligase
MIPEKVRIVFNDDGCDVVQVGEERLEFGGMDENVEVVAESLRAEGFVPSVTPLKEGGLDEFVRSLRQDSFDIVFNLCEGAFENSIFEMNVAAMLELFGLKFTGSGPMALGIALNKALTKDVLTRRGIPTPGYFVARDLPVTVPVGLRPPFIVKPLREDASIGIEADAVVKNMPSEIDFSDFPEGAPRICCYEAKWITVSPLYINSPPVCPADVPETVARELGEVALKAYDAIGCRDYARVDMRLSPDGGVRVLEVNPNPDISTDAGFARAAKSAGLEYHQLIGEIVRVAAARYQEPISTAEQERADSHEEGDNQG